MLKKLLAVIMSLSMVISVASFRINSVEALGNQYRESRDVFVADCVINGLLDKSGNRANTFSLISSTITHKYTYKALAEALMDDQTLVFNSAFWNTVNKSLKGEFSTVFQQRRLFYETILMDYLAYVDHSEEYKSSFNQDCAKYEYDISKKLVEVAGKNYKNSVDEIIKNQSLSDAIEFSDKYGFIYQLNKFNGLVSSIKENATSAKDYYDALKSALAIKNANVSRIAFLKQMKKVASDNTDFCDAVDEIIGLYEGNYATIILDVTGVTVAQHLTDWAWGDLLELLPSAYSAALETIKLGQKTLDFIFNSNDTAENNLKLLILYIIGNYARESATNLRTVFNGSQTASNGSDFINGYLEYVIYQKYATELASGYVQESTYDGLWNQIKNSFNGTDTTYAQFKKYFEDDISISKNYINQVVNYYNLHNSYYGDFTDKSSEIVDSGTSNNMSWNLNGNGVLTISGTGNMPNYSSTSQPWYKYRESIKQVKIGDGITGIGDYAFSGCTNLTSVTIPGNVTSIGDYAFSNCNSLVANVYKNSIGLTYCKNNKIDYRIVGSYDKKHYIQIENGTCTNIDESTELKVSQLKEGNDYDVVSKSFDNFELYDLSFYKDDQKVTIDGTAIVRIPVKEGMDGSKCKVYYNDNGTFTDMGAVYKDGYMEFETNHFSQYVVAEIESSTFTLGDVNEDDKVDFLDAIVVLRHDAEIIQLTDNQMKAAEVNKDGKVDFLDAIMILRYDAEIIGGFN